MFEHVSRTILSSVATSYKMLIPIIRGLHSPTFRLNISTFCGVRWVGSWSVSDTSGSGCAEKWTRQCKSLPIMLFGQVSEPGWFVSMMRTKLFSLVCPALSKMVRKLSM